MAGFFQCVRKLPQEIFDFVGICDSVVECRGRFDVGLCLSLWQSSHCLAFDRVGTLDNRGTVVNYLCGIPRYYIIDRPRIGDYRYGRSRGVTKTGYGAEQDCTL